MCAYAFVCLCARMRVCMLLHPCGEFSMFLSNGVFFLGMREQAIEELMLAGMDCVRLNCAHDQPDEWLRLIGTSRVTYVTFFKNFMIIHACTSK